MWCSMWLFSSALATDLAFQLETSEGLQERWTKDHTGSWTAQFGPLEGRGKRSVRYDVTIPASVYDPLVSGFETRVTICRYWYKGSKRDRDCVEDVLVVPSEADGPVWVGGKIKGTDKFELRLGAYFQGLPPGQAPVVEEEPEPAVEEEVVEEPAEDEKDEMTSTLESIASQVVDSLDEEEAEEPEGADEASEEEAPVEDEGKKKRKK